MCPYIFREDILMYEFVWGYLPEHSTFYKVLTTEVVSAEIVEIEFEVIPTQFICMPKRMQ
jgi:hypothetical protein